MCPFCYIGKKRFENALQQFAHRDQVEVAWKSFQLNPDLVTGQYANINDYLAAVKGISREQAAEMNRQVAAMAAESGVVMNPERSIPANSFRAHRLIHFARSQGNGTEVAGLLFRAYFEDGLNVDDVDVLVDVAGNAGLDRDETRRFLEDRTLPLAEAVEQDIYEARQIGVRGVPYFVFGDKYAVSGAQAEATFLGALEQTWKESGG